MKLEYIFDTSLYRLTAMFMKWSGQRYENINQSYAIWKAQLITLQLSLFHAWPKEFKPCNELIEWVPDNGGFLKSIFKVKGRGFKPQNLHKRHLYLRACVRLQQNSPLIWDNITFQNIKAKTVRLTSLTTFRLS